jgi:hypothetical protein
VESRGRPGERSLVDHRDQVLELAQRCHAESLWLL